MRRKLVVYLELIGAALVLASAGWELFIERPLGDMSQGAAFYRVEKKLDAIWLQMGAVRQKVDPDPKTTISTIYASEAGRDWRWAGNTIELRNLEWQSDTARAFRGVLFILGSVLLLAARRAELLRSLNESHG
jgi:hypothetical protein